MNIYYAPLACSLAARIALAEAGVEARAVRVDAKAKRTEDGRDYFAINPMGQVPALELDDGQVLTENSAILPYLAERFPAAGLAPTDPVGRARLAQWLGFVNSELHSVVFHYLLSPQPDAVKAAAVAQAGPRLAVLNAHLEDREHLLDAYSVADIYLWVVLNWTQATPLKLADWPALDAFYKRLRQRPHVARLAREETALFTRAA